MSMDRTTQPRMAPVCEIIIHVNDLADAHVRALQYLASPDYEKVRDTLAINLGTGRGHSVLEVMQAAEDVTGKPVRRTMKPRRPGDPPTLVADPTKAHTVLGFVTREILPTSCRLHGIGCRKAVFRNVSGTDSSGG